MTAEDRRQYRRSLIGLPVGIGLDRNTPVRYSGHTIDLSERGALLDVTESWFNATSSPSGSCTPPSAR